MYHTKTSVEEWRAISTTTIVKEKSAQCLKWYVTPVGLVKINVDASFFKTELKIVIGMVLRDEKRGSVLRHLL